MHVIRSALFATVLAAGAAAAQNYPVKPITMVVPFSAGGPTDTIGRILGERIGKSLGQTVLVENTTGAGGSIAVGRVVRAAPDGYILSIGHLGTHVITGATYQLQYDALRDLAPVAMVATNPQILVSKTAIAAKDLKELVAWVGANGNKVSIGTGGAGTPAHVSAVYFKQLTGSEAQIIHYRGAAPAMTDLFAGHIDLYFDQAVTAVPNSRSGRVKPYAGALTEALAEPAVRQRLTDLGQEIPPREQQTPEALAAHHKAEIDKWWPLIKAAGIKAE
jgi:tripartite-type tricarboxylate transporter receptor subunit TctC